MGLGQSNPAETEEMEEHDDVEILDIKSKQSNSSRREEKSIQAQSNQSALPKQTRYAPKNNSGSTNAEFTPELKLGRRNEEKNYSDKIIREKEKLLKEKEETIRQQANLIKTQHELLGQRKLMNMPDISLAKVHYDVVFKPRILKPTETAEFSGSSTSHGNGHENIIPRTADNNFEKKYFFDRNNVARLIQPTRQEQSNQKFNIPSPTSFTNPQVNHFTFGIPLQHRSGTSTSADPYQPTFYPSHSSIFNVPPPNLNVLTASPTPTMQPKKYSNNEYRRNNTKNYELRDDVVKQSTNQLLDDLEKQTSYELQKLNNVQSGSSPHETVDVKKTVGDKTDKQSKFVRRIFKCHVCSVTWNSKPSFNGASQKCKKCGNDVGIRIKNWKRDDENRTQNGLVSKTETISNVDW